MATCERSKGGNNQYPLEAFVPCTSWVGYALTIHLSNPETWSGTSKEDLNHVRGVHRRMTHPISSAEHVRVATLTAGRAAAIFAIFTDDGLQRLGNPCL